jgi:hypothetical protein
MKKQGVDVDGIYDLFAIRIILETSPSPSQGGEIASEVKDDNYVVFHIPLTSHLSPFTFYLCRQIVRDHGEATNLRGCGITTDNNQVTITLPRYHGQV